MLRYVPMVVGHQARFHAVERCQACSHAVEAYQECSHAAEAAYQAESCVEREPHLTAEEVSLRKHEVDWMAVAAAALAVDEAVVAELV